MQITHCKFQRCSVFILLLHLQCMYIIPMQKHMAIPCPGLSLGITLFATHTFHTEENINRFSWSVQHTFQNVQFSLLIMYTFYNAYFTKHTYHTKHVLFHFTMNTFYSIYKAHFYNQHFYNAHFLHCTLFKLPINGFTLQTFHNTNSTVCGTVCWCMRWVVGNYHFLRDHQRFTISLPLPVWSPQYIPVWSPQYTAECIKLAEVYFHILLWSSFN